MLIELTRYYVYWRWVKDVFSIKLIDGKIIMTIRVITSKCCHLAEIGGGGSTLHKGTAGPNTGKLRLQGGLGPTAAALTPENTHANLSSSTREKINKEL